MKKQEIAVDVFFALLRAGLWEQGTRVSSFGEIDFGRVFEIARGQSSLGVVVAGLEHVEDMDSVAQVIEPLAGEIADMELWSRMMSFTAGVLVDKMREAGIKAVLVKGQGIAQCYEKPLRRVAGDIDFLLDDENYEKAKVFISSLSKEKGKEGLRHKHYHLKIDPWIVELHGTMHSGLTRRMDEELDRIQEDTFRRNTRVWNNDGVEVLLPGVDNDAVFVFSHILQHYYREGIGLRQVCDWCRLLWTYRDTVDHSLLESRLVRMGVLREWKTFASFAVGYLGMPAEAMPLYEGGRAWERRARRVYKFILKTGNFGRNRDSSFYSKYPYLVYKIISFARHCGDTADHLMVFPRTSFVVFWHMVFNGIRNVFRGE